MPHLNGIGWTPFLVFMKAEVDCETYINENTASNSQEDLGNGLLMICAIKEAVRKWEGIPEDLKRYFSKRATSWNKGAHRPNPNKKVDNDIIRELGSQTGFFSTILRFRAEWFEENFEKKSMGLQMVEMLFLWKQLNKKDKKWFHKLWKADNPG